MGYPNTLRAAGLVAAVCFCAAWCTGADSSSVDTAVVVPLSGELPRKVINPGRPYLVVADISVRPGETVLVEPGTVFLFKNFTGLQIHGVLRAEAAQDTPIVFTSENDSRYSPLSTMDAAPYDWNGVTVFENAVGTTFEHCRLGYSLYGINALTDQVIIRDCRFYQNARSDLSINGTVVAVGETAFSNELGAMPEPELKALLSGVPPKKIRPAMVALRIGTAAVGLAALGYGAYKTMDYRESQEHFEAVDDVSRQRKEDPRIYDKWEKAYDDRNKDRLLMTIGYVGSGLGLAGFTVSFFF